ncbi:MAG TPA: sulfurtransferase TusA family protein [Dongiaceae bacterium]|jgi:tRNA 2-thiouridine synthesizing protein A|nr:sulfurtransferase TusA family protein [Dongiaceae bacterium]
MIDASDTNRGATELDARGLKCPLPVLKARRALQGVAPGGLLRVLATDPGAVKDFAHFCETTGCELVESGREGEVLRFLLRKPA